MVTSLSLQWHQVEIACECIIHMSFQWQLFIKEGIRRSLLLEKCCIRAFCMTELTIRLLHCQESCAGSTICIIGCSRNQSLFLFEDKNICEIIINWGSLSFWKKLDELFLKSSRRWQVKLLGPRSTYHLFLLV